MTRTHSDKTRASSDRIAARRGRWSRLAGVGVLAAALAGMTSGAAPAQTAVRPMPSAAPALVPVPTVKLLAIGSFTAGATPEAWKLILPAEMRGTARLYLSGRIDQWYVKQDQSGVVFILNFTDPREAQALLENLPLGKAGLMKFQIIPLGPLSPLRTLLRDPSERGAASGSAQTDGWRERHSALGSSPERQALHAQRP